MIKELALSIGGQNVTAPGEVPTGGQDTLQKIIQLGITISMLAVIILASFVIIMGGIQWTTSGGDKQKIHQARLRITFAIVGLIVALLALFVINLIFGFMGVKLF